MKVLVLGGGVIGVTSAWYLRQAGHAVTLVDRQAEPGMETSFANGGQISAGSATPWAAPHIPLTALKWMLQPNSPLVMRPRPDPAMWRWLFEMLANCTPAKYLRNRERLLRLARYSRAELERLRAQTGIDYDAGARGMLTVYRDSASLERDAREAKSLERLGIVYEVLDRAGCERHEPGLARAHVALAGGIYYPEDETGDCRKFTLELARRTAEQGVQFLPSTRIERLRREGDRITGVATSAGELEADVYVLALGSYAPYYLGQVGIRLPVYPVKGYSMTLPVADEPTAPQGSLLDERYKTVVTRLGNRIRVAGTAELAGYDYRLRPSRLVTLERVVRDLFPGVIDVGRAEYWAGLRPMTPDNPPVLGATPCRNLVLNTGHGSLGWTLACGSGKAIADVVSGRPPEVPLEDYALSRFG